MFMYLFIYVIFIYLFTCLFPILYPTQDRPSGLGLHGFSLSQVILRLSYLEWRRLFLKLSSCKTSSLGNVVSNIRLAPLSLLSSKRQSMVCFKVLLSKISVQGLRKMRNVGITDLRTKN